MDKQFYALQVRLGDSGVERNIIKLDTDSLPPGEVLIRVRYSSLNYKDALSANGNTGVTKRYPHVPGIDAAGEVIRSQSPQFSQGDKVLVTGYDLGMNTSGGFGQCVRVPANWVVPLPPGLDERQAMCYGTAGFTAAQAVAKITTHCQPDDGEVVVSGASGGVGSMAVAILARLGYRPVAATRNPAKAGWLHQVGATRLIATAELPGDTGRPLLPASWEAGFDTVGGDVLAGILKAAGQRALVCCCGNAASGELPISVYPFILRGVCLAGIDSQHCPSELRRTIWQKLAGEWKVDFSAHKIEEVCLAELSKAIDAMLAGRHSGRTLVRLD